MGLFGKNKQHKNSCPAQGNEKNEIANLPLKEHLMNLAIEKLLTEGQDYHQLAYTTCEFGYLFHIDNHGLETLFKMETDVGVFYFGAQGGSLMRLAFNEELFQMTTKNFLSRHGQPAPPR